MPFVTACLSSFLGAMLLGRDRVIRRLEYELFGYWPEHEYFTWRRQLPAGLFPRLLLLLSPPAGWVTLLGSLLGPGPFALPPPPSSFPRPVGFSRVAFPEQPVLVLLVPLAFVFSLLGVPLRLVSDICLPRLADVFGDLCLPPPPCFPSGSPPLAGPSAGPCLFGCGAGGLGPAVVAPPAVSLPRSLVGGCARPPRSPPFEVSGRVCFATPPFRPSPPATHFFPGLVRFAAGVSLGRRI